jgi:hypothetical protein
MSGDADGGRWVPDSRFAASGMTREGAWVGAAAFNGGRGVYDVKDRTGA